MNSLLQSPEEPCVIEQRVPPPTDDAVVPLEVGLVVRPMRLAPNQEVCVLKGDHKAWEFALFHVRPGMELLTHTAEEGHAGEEGLHGEGEPGADSEDGGCWPHGRLENL